RFRGEQTAREETSSGRVAAELRSAGTEDEAEEVCRVARENGVGLSARDLRCAGDFGDATEVIPEIGAEWAEGLVDGERHRREEPYAVGLPLRAEPHDAIEETVSALP